ncbi:MAG TPA: S8 family serine peptidase [Bacteroidia bacterium]|nr:S8 family serine peptidase [Bacteroidia bacterium]
MKKVLVTYCFLLIALLGICQAPTKFDFYLANKQVAFDQGKEDGNKMMEILIQGNIAGIKRLVDQYNGVFKYSYGNIAAIRIPIKALYPFYLSNSVKRMEGAPEKLRVCNDTMRMHAHITEVQMGMSPLTQPYKGKGVILGLIDTGIDFIHPDFRDSLNKSRILSIWDMNQPVNALTPSPYGYGQEFDKPMLDTALADSNPATLAYMDSACKILYAHGTHVAGVATSNGRSNGLSIGAAPEADIMMVAYNFTTQTATEMTDAVSFIYNKANAYGEPCVINASLGDYDGSHDGYDLQAQMIDSMVTAKPGRVFVAAAGNESNIPYHLGYTVTPGDTSFTWFAFYASDGTIYYDVWADTANFRKVQYSIGVDRVAPFSSITTTPYKTVLNNLGTIVFDTIKNAKGNRIGILQTYSQLVGKTYSLTVQIFPDSTSYYWRFMTTGSGKIDCWYPDPTPIVNSGLPSPAVFPEIKNYKMPDTISTLCSSYQCSPNVITVGDYFNRKTYINYADTLFAYYGSNVTEGNLTYYSGSGPTRDGRIKPDIASPGDLCMSALPVPLRAYYIANGPQDLDQGGWHHVDGGTSTAAPGTAGVAALYLEENPGATNIEVKNAIISCSDQDQYTGVTPNNSYGYGKVDAFNTLTGCSLGIKTIQRPLASLNAFPNPMKDGTTIQYDFSSMPDYCNANIALYDVLGKQIKNIELKNNKGSISVSTNNIVSGTYFYSLIIDGKRIDTEKLMEIR